MEPFCGNKKTRSKLAQGCTNQKLPQKMILESLKQPTIYIEAIYGCTVESHGLRTLKHESKLYKRPFMSGYPVYHSHHTTSQNFQLSYIFLKSWPVYSGHPVYNGHLVVSHGWPLYTCFILRTSTNAKSEDKIIRQKRFSSIIQS